VRRGGRGPWDRVGYLVDSPAPYPGLTVLENLRSAARLRGVGDDAVTRAVERLALGRYSERKARSLSQGNRQRLGLAMALFHEPELVILDEPGNGLDPAGVVEVRDLLRSLAAERGVTVLMSSHILAEVDRLATRVGIIHRGRLIEELSTEEMERRRERRLIVEARDTDGARALLATAGYEPAAANGCLVLTQARAVQRPDDVAAALAAGGHPPTKLAVEQEDLEEHFLRLTSHEEAS
jgi:ABC-2 type transport system ATP-binding protein